MPAPPLVHRRRRSFAGAFALLLVARLAGSWAERIRAASPAPAGGGDDDGAGHGGADAPRPPETASRRRSFGLLLGVAAAASAAAPAVRAQADGITVDMFNYLDRNKDGRLSAQEYKQAWVFDTPARQVQYNTMCQQADIDDDGFLSMAELQFARYLVNEETINRGFENSEYYLPEGFREGIDNTFWKLREGASGFVTLVAVTTALEAFLGYENGFGEHDAARVQGLFRWADVTGDGSLNLNELDFFHFLARESMIDGKLSYLIERHSAYEEDDEPMYAVFGLWGPLITGFDEDGDGRLSLSELLTGMPYFFVDARADRVVFRERIKREFPRFDADDDGTLNSTEARWLVNGAIEWMRLGPSHDAP